MHCLWAGLELLPQESNARAKPVPGSPVKTMLGREMPRGYKEHNRTNFLMSHDLQRCSCPHFSLHGKQILFPAMLFRYVRMVLGNGGSQWSLPCTLTLESTQGSGLVGGVAQADLPFQREVCCCWQKCPLGWTRGRILPTWVETTHPGATSLLRSLSVLPSPLRHF